MPAETKKKESTKTKPKNDVLAPGVTRYGRHHLRRLTGRYFKFQKAKKVGFKAKKKGTKRAAKVVPFNTKKNKDEKRSIATKTPKFYPADVVPKPLPTARILRPAKLRPSLTPGTVVILLVGRYKGQRAIILRHLASGLLLVTGPYKLNGIPLRRVNPVYVIATSTKVDLKGIDSSSVNDEFFKIVKQVEKTTTEKKSEKSVVVSEKKEEKKKKIEAARITAQKHIDEPLLKHIKSVPQLHSYLSSTFSLKNGDYPHAMKF